jgi:hypothetical protein
MSEAVRRVQARARELAGSGKFAGWRAVAFELQFEPGFSDAYAWLYSPSTKEELEGLCKEARKQREVRSHDADLRGQEGKGKDMRHQHR